MNSLVLPERKIGISKRYTLTAGTNVNLVALRDYVREPNAYLVALDMVIVTGAVKTGVVSAGVADVGQSYSMSMINSVPLWRSGIGTSWSGKVIVKALESLSFTITGATAAEVLLCTAMLERLI